MKKHGIYDELVRAHLMIEGALAHPEMMKALAKLDFDTKEVMRGKALLTKVENQQYERETEENAQKESTRQLHAAYAEAYASYITHVKYARMVVPPQSKAWNDLRLSGARRKDMNGWLMQAQAFYRHADTIAELLTQRGILPEELAQAQAMIDAVTDARVQQNLRKSNKQRAKVKRDQEREALQQWISKFVKAARYAFDDDRQQLEALGIVVPA